MAAFDQEPPERGPPDGVLVARLPLMCQVAASSQPLRAEVAHRERGCGVVQPAERRAAALDRTTGNTCRVVPFSNLGQETWGGQRDGFSVVFGDGSRSQLPGRAMAKGSPTSGSVSRSCHLLEVLFLDKAACRSPWYTPDFKTSKAPGPCGEVEVEDHSSFEHQSCRRLPTTCS